MRHLYLVEYCWEPSEVEAVCVCSSRELAEEFIEEYDPTHAHRYRVTSIEFYEE